MRRASGYAVWTSIDGPQLEADSIACCHCGGATLISHAADVRAIGRAVGVSGNEADLGGFCTLCGKHTCSRCAADGRCFPFEARMAVHEQGRRFRDMIG